MFHVPLEVTIVVFQLAITVFTGLLAVSLWFSGPASNQSASEEVLILVINSVFSLFIHLSFLFLANTSSLRYCSKILPHMSGCLANAGFDVLWIVSLFRSCVTCYVS